MSLESIVMEGVFLGAIFTQVEVFFTAGLLQEYRMRGFETGIPFPYKDEPKSALRGHSYPFMFALGALSAPWLHYASSSLKETVQNPLIFYAAGGLLIAGVEYACGKLNIAPWREVYKYLEARFKNGFPKLKNIPLTLADSSVFIPLIPLWSCMGVLADYLHEAIHKI